MKPSFLLALITLLCGFASAQQSYTFQQIVVNTEPTVATAINDAAGAVGYYYVGDGGKGFGYKNGNWLQANVPGATQTYPFGINSAGQIVGQYADQGACSHSCGFILTGSTVTTLAVNGNQTGAYGINRSGQVAGYYFDGHHTHGFLYGAGKYIRIDFPGGKNTSLNGINDARSVLGNSDTGGFVYQNGQFSDVVFPGSNSTSAQGINNAGQVAGLYFDQHAVLHGFVLSGGIYTTVDYPGDVTGSGVTGINDEGQIVGYYFGGDCPAESCGFVGTPVK